jgi:pimeloyl-ACP methyl ester carboxylesterase
MNIETRGRLVTGDGVRLLVREHGDPARPTVVCLHGYPDHSNLWDGVVAALVDRFHVVTYDVRGTGGSDKPRGRAAYRLDRLERDFVAVLDAVSPAEPVHLLAHDWGAVQAWHFVTGERARQRIASFTSISGPCLDHIGYFVRSRLRPDPNALAELGGQLAKSWYVLFFQLPVLPELFWRSGAGTALLGTLERIGDGRTTPSGQRPMADYLNGLELYRANIPRRLSGPQQRGVDVPVQVIAPTQDPFVSVRMQTDIERWASDLRVRTVPGGHWLPRSQPELVARLTAEHVGDVLDRSGTRGA